MEKLRGDTLSKYRASLEGAVDNIKSTVIEAGPIEKQVLVDHYYKLFVSEVRETKPYINLATAISTFTDQEKKNKALLRRSAEEADEVETSLRVDRMRKKVAVILNNELSKLHPGKQPKPKGSHSKPPARRDSKTNKRATRKNGKGKQGNKPMVKSNNTKKARAGAKTDTGRKRKN